MRGRSSFTWDVSGKPGQEGLGRGTKPPSWGTPGSGAISQLQGLRGRWRKGRAILVASQAALADGTAGSSFSRKQAKWLTRLEFRASVEDGARNMTQDSNSWTKPETQGQGRAQMGTCLGEPGASLGLRIGSRLGQAEDIDMGVEDGCQHAGLEGLVLLLLELRSGVGRRGSNRGWQRLGPGRAC